MIFSVFKRKCNILIVHIHRNRFISLRLFAWKNINTLTCFMIKKTRTFPHHSPINKIASLCVDRSSEKPKKYTHGAWRWMARPERSRWRRTQDNRRFLILRRRSYCAWCAWRRKRKLISFGRRWARHGFDRLSIDQGPVVPPFYCAHTTLSLSLYPPSLHSTHTSFSVCCRPPWHDIMHTPPFGLYCRQEKKYN